MGIRLLGLESVYSSSISSIIYNDVDSSLSVADYCAELELATPFTGRVTNAGGTPAVRDTGAWYARCQDSDEVNAWVRVDNTTLTFADIYLSSDLPTKVIEIVPGFSYDIEVWALSATNTVQYGEATSTNGSLVITLNLPNHITPKDLKGVYDDLVFTLGNNLVASDVWGMQAEQTKGTGGLELLAQNIYSSPLRIAMEDWQWGMSVLVPHAYDSTDFVTLTFVDDANVSLKAEYDFATTEIPVTNPANGQLVFSGMAVYNLYYTTTEGYGNPKFLVGGSTLMNVASMTTDTQVDVTATELIDVTLNLGDVTSIGYWGGSEDITSQLPLDVSAETGITLGAFISSKGLTTTPTATGWKDMSDDTAILSTDVLVDGQSIYPYI